jgi:hypothetical protein
MVMELTYEWLKGSSGPPLDRVARPEERRDKRLD